MDCLVDERALAEDGEARRGGCRWTADGMGVPDEHHVCARAVGREIAAAPQAAGGVVAVVLLLASDGLGPGDGGRAVGHQPERRLHDRRHAQVPAVPEDEGIRR